MPLGTILQANGQVWNGPGEPAHSGVPAGTEPRGWPYPQQWNASSEPRTRKVQESGGISHTDCRILADQVHVRAAIETVKNAQTKKEFTFTLRPEPGERSTETLIRTQKDPRIKEVTDFFLEPDGEHDFAEWGRMLFEDLLVIDAPTLYCVTRINGKPDRLEVFDGSTITPLLDEGGRTPRGIDPRTGREYEAYQQWLYGVPGQKFSRREMMYAPRNPRPGKAFGKSPVEQLAFYINIALRKDIQRLATYTDGNIPAGMLPMPGDWKPPQIREWWNDFTTFVKGLPQNLVKLVPLPGGVGQPIFPSLESNKDLWEESWIRLVCFAFDIPVSALVREMTKATAETNRDSADQDGAAAYADWYRRRINWILRNWFGYADIIAVPKREVDVDPLIQSQIDEAELRTGKSQVNELRERDGKAPFAQLQDRPGYFGPGGWTPFDAAIAAVDIENVNEAGDAAASESSPAGAAVDVASPAPTQSAAPQTEGLRVGDITAAQAIVKDVAAGAIPRDAGEGQLKAFFKFDDATIALVMGSAGKSDVPTTPNPKPSTTENPGPTPEQPVDQLKAHIPIEHELAKSAPPFDFGSTQVNLKGEIANNVLALGVALIPDEALAEKGRESTPHVTVKFGIAAGVKAASMYDAIENSDTAKEIAERGATMTLGATAVFEADEYDVVYVSVESPDLVSLNQIVSDAVPVTDTKPEYIPHATLAYVKKGEGAKFAGDDTLSGTVVTFDSIVFSDTEGNETEIPLAGESAKAKRRVKLTLAKPSAIAAKRASLAKAIAKFLARQKVRIADALVAEFQDRTKASDVGTISIDWSELVDILEPNLEQVYKSGAKSAAKDLGTDPFDRLNEAARDYARERAAEMVGKKWVDTGSGYQLVDNPDARHVITDSTRDTLRDLVERAIDDGMSPDELRKAILESTEFSPERARMVADTELAEAQGYGSLREWNESGVVKKKGWLLSGNHGADDDCDRNAAVGEIAIDQKFPSGHMTSPAHPHCDCDVYAVVE